jgi:hypothetical protein
MGYISNIIMRIRSIYLILIPIALKVQVLFLQLKSGTFYLANNICFPSNNPTIAAEGPENSVPAMGCVAIKFLL